MLRAFSIALGFCLVSLGVLAAANAALHRVAAGVLQLMRSDTVAILGREWLLFDIGGAVAIAGFLVAFVAAQR